MRYVATSKAEVDLIRRVHGEPWPIACVRGDRIILAHCMASACQFFEGTLTDAEAAQLAGVPWKKLPQLPVLVEVWLCGTLAALIVIVFKL